jgi:hypothetical protein
MVQESEHQIANEEHRTSINAKAVTMVSGDNGSSISLMNPLPVGFGDSANIDAFSRLRVSQPTNLFSVSAQYGAVTVQMERGATGTGIVPTHDANTRLCVLSCTAGSGTSFMQSYKYIPYQPAKSHEIAVTFVCGAAVAGAVFEAGYFDTYNGIFFRQNGTSGLQVVRRTSTSGSVVDNAVNQADWNIDKLDGTGRSGLTLDITKAQILFIDLQFLGMGRVRCGFDIDGVLYYFHEFKNANNLDVPYMQSGTLPLQILVTATSTATTKTSYFKCAAVHSEGGFEEDRAYQLSTPDVSATAGNGTRAHIVSIRPKTTYNGIINREDLVLGPISMLVTGNSPVYWELLIGGTFSVAPTWADINTASSAFEYGTGGTFSGLGTGGIVIASGYVAASAQQKEALSADITSKYACALNRAGAQIATGTFTLVATGIGAASAMRAAINFKEIR